MNHKPPKKIPIVFHNGSTFGYHFIIIELAKEFKGEFKCLGENTEKYITFLVTIKNDNGKTYTRKFIRFMSRSLSDLADSLPDRLHVDKCTDSMSYLYYMSFRDDQLIFR